MKFKNPLLVVEDMAAAVAFYQKILGLHVIADFGANVTLTGGVALQTKESWLTFIHQQPENIVFQNCAGELYFEETDFDCWLERFLQEKDIVLVHPLMEHRWGQRVIRFYDLDGHIIEVGEPMAAVIKRFLEQGMTPEVVAARMEIPIKMVKRFSK